MLLIYRILINLIFILSPIIILIRVFKKKEDAIKFLSEFQNIVKYKTELVLLEITISENLQAVKCSNKYHKDLEAVAGCIMEKIVEGKVKRFLSEVTLVSQGFVKNPDQSIEQLLKENNASIIAFARFKVGEGIEVEVKDFAAEVAEQLQK